MRTFRRLPRIGRAVTLIVTGVLVCAALSVVAASAGPYSVTVRAGCAFPSGPVQLPVQVAGTFQDNAAVRKPLAAKGFSFTVTLPAELVAALRAEHATTIEGSLNAALTTVQGTQHSTFALHQVSIPLTVIPDSAELRIPVSVSLPEISGSSAGALTIGVTDIQPAFTVHSIKNNALHADPVTCTPAPPAELATVTLRGPDPSAPTDAGAGGSPSMAQLLTANGIDPKAAAAGLQASYWVDNTVSRISKLGSNLSFGRGRFDAVVGIGSSSTNPMTGTLTMPKASGYFVSFRFMPVNNDVQIVQQGTANGTVHVHLPLADIDVKLKIMLQLSKVKVNGVPLDVGPKCSTAVPTELEMKGTIGLTAGSPPTTMHSVFTIPPFSGCGATENLDPLLTGMVSGPGNELTTTLAVRCIGGAGCPPDSVKPGGAR